MLQIAIDLAKAGGKIEEMQTIIDLQEMKINALRNEIKILEKKLLYEVKPTA